MHMQQAHICDTYVCTHSNASIHLLRARGRALKLTYHQSEQQWLTVFGGICFMLVDLIDAQYEKDQPGSGRSFIGVLIFMSESRKAPTLYET